MMKILFVILDYYKNERLGIQILSAISIQERFDRKLLILNNQSTEETLKIVQDWQPDIVAYSAMTYEHFELQAFNRLLKQSGMKFISIFGGPHYTFNPEEINNDKYIDVVCRGEGENAWRSFIRAVSTGEDYRNIEKLWVRDGEDVIENPVGELIENLDTVPYADRTLLYVDLEKDHAYGKSMAVMLSRGCPQKCSYCFNVQYNEMFDGSRIYRYRSIDNVIDEIKELVDKYKLEHITIFDDVFSYFPKKYMAEFCKKYKAEVNLPFAAQFRPESVKEEIVIMLRDAGLFIAPIGVESGNEEVAQGILQRGKVTNQDMINAFAILHKHGIRTWSLNLMALPVDDPLTVDWETIDLNVKLKPFWSQWNLLIPIPNTPIWHYMAENKKYLDPEVLLQQSNKLPSGYTSTPLKFKNPSHARKVSNLHKFAGIVVKYPFLKPVVKLLIILPENKLFLYMFMFWLGYWKSIGSYNAKPSLSLVINGLKAIRMYMKTH